MSEQPSKSMIEFYESRAFIIPYMLVHFIGLWPWQPKKYLINAFWLTMTAILTFPQVNGLIVNRHNPDAFMDNLLMSSVMFALFLKLFTIVISAKKCKQQYLAIAENYALIVDEEEKEIFRKYSERGRLINLAYVGFQCIVYVAFVFGPLVPSFLNVVYPLEAPRQHLYQLRGIFPFENRDDHYAFIYSWDTTATTTVISIGAPIDLMYAATVEQALALLAVLTLLKLKRMVSNDPSVTTDNSYQYMVEIIKLHQRSFKFVNLVEESYSLCFLVLIWLNFIFMPIICLLVLMNMDKFVNVFRYVLFFGTAIVHLFNIIWPGQKLIDHSDDIYIAAYFNEWYACSKQTKQLIHIFLLRCSQPALLTGGGLMVLNFENYAAIVKTAVSYITVFSSFR